MIVAGSQSQRTGGTTALVPWYLVPQAVLLMVVVVFLLTT